MIDRTLPRRAVSGDVRWELAVRYLTRRSSLARRVYWRVAPAYHRRRYDAETNAWDAPPNPFAIHWVDPDRIERFTGREYPPWRNRRSAFGSVRGGGWDLQQPDPGPEYDLHRRLYLADTVRESTVHRSFRAHFEDGVPWERTPFIRTLVAALDSGADRVWHGCTDRSAIHDRCGRMDRLYAAIETDGYRTQVELAKRGGSARSPVDRPKEVDRPEEVDRPGEVDRPEEVDRPGGFLDAREHEIAVDIGRDGSLLFVSGRHRLSIATILGLDAVPVVVLVRHADWMARRGVTVAADVDDEHPDLPD